MTLVQTELKKIYLWPNVAAMQWPCPTGFHVPTSDEWTAVKTAMTTLWIDTSNGNCCKTYLKMPFAWFRSRNNSSPDSVDSNWYYNSSILANSETVTGTRISSSLFNTTWIFVLSWWRSILPFKNTPSIPDNSWTTLYWTLSAWIFMKDWLISISSDWTNWITIADKNLWATTVYNDWDTLAESNCWWYYQRWNNYMFPFTWTVTTSSTKVDASTYWPWNYYSSSTFITASSSPYNWDSSNNTNLRWWVSWATKEIKRVTIRPNGTEKLIRPVWWQPWANTIAYYPLTDDFNDYGWNSYNLTQNSAQITTLNWVKCCDLNSSYCAANFAVNTLPCTMAFRHKSKVTTNKFLAICFADSTRNWGGRWIWTWNVDELQVRYWNPTNTYSPVNYTFNTNWNLYVLTLSDAKWTLYINSDTYQLKTNLSAPSWSGSPLRIWANEVWQTWWGNWYISQIIVENKARTAQEVSDYYNQTKWNYWL